MNFKVVLLVILFSSLFSFAQQSEAKWINGTYKGCPEKDNASLWAQIKPFQTDTFCRKNLSVKISIVNEKRISFILLDDSIQLKQKNVKYKQEGDRIVIKKRWNREMKGIPLLLFSIRTERIEISKENEHAIKVKCKGGAWGMLFFLNTGFHINQEDVYKKI